jgi:hypothetical protein
MDMLAADAPIRRVGYDGLDGVTCGLLVPVVPCQARLLNLCWVGEVMMWVFLVDFDGFQSAFWVQALTKAEVDAIALFKVLVVARSLCSIPEVLARMAG